MEVRDELVHESAPKSVRKWMADPPAWVQIHTESNEAPKEAAWLRLDMGERAAIALAESIRADLLLIAERAGAILAQQRGFAVTGTLGILDLASRQGFVLLRNVFPQLQNTNFRYPPSLIEELLNDERARE